MRIYCTEHKALRRSSSPRKADHLTYQVHSKQEKNWKRVVSASMLLYCVWIPFWFPACLPECAYLLWFLRSSRTFFSCVQRTARKGSLSQLSKYTKGTSGTCLAPSDVKVDPNPFSFFLQPQRLRVASACYSCFRMLFNYRNSSSVLVQDDRRMQAMSSLVFSVKIPQPYGAIANGSGGEERMCFFECTNVL